MTASQQLVVIFAGVGAVLTIATAIARTLALRATSAGMQPVVANLNTRIDAWWAIVAALAAAFAFGAFGITSLFAVLSFLSLREFITCSRSRPKDHRALCLAFFVVLPLQYYFVLAGRYEFFITLIPIYIFMCVPMLSAACGETTQFLERTAEIQWGLMLCVFCLSHVPALAMLDIADFEGDGIVLMAFVLLVTQASDVLQYVFGKLLGKRKIAPGLSPAKTVAGVVGGIGSATLLGVSVSPLTPFAPWQAGLLAFIVAIAGFLGGLVMSAIKRSCGTKDWGWLIPGHGGVLDRVDSVAFAAPLFFHIVKVFWAD